ncbi:hypothetical protein XO88_004626 [Salmonella enterica subsp. enterica serovar Anatum]|nr:hypothetical protein [Salmonella enterica subsp. enterica serovar Anatum]
MRASRTFLVDIKELIIILWLNESKPSEITLPSSVFRQIWTHASGCIVMHAGKIWQMRFWRFSGWFVAGFTRFPSETR